MLIAVLRIGLAVSTCCLVYGQTADKALTFDAASVKPATPPTPDGRGMVMIAGPSGGPGTKDPGRIHYPYMSLKNILMNAYDTYQQNKLWARVSTPLNLGQFMPAKCFVGGGPGAPWAWPRFVQGTDQVYFQIFGDPAAWAAGEARPWPSSAVWRIPST